MRRFRIALCQITPTFDKSGNVERAVSMIEEAARNGAQLIALPEIFYYPFELLRLRGIAGDEEKILDRFRELARVHGVHLCSGSMMVLQGTKRFNTSHLIGPQGDVLLSHNKCHLFDSSLEGMRVKESLVFSYGDRLEVAATDLGTMGIIICYDIRFPETARQVAVLGADLLIVPAVFNQVTGPAHWACIVRTRAIENQFFVAAISQGLNRDSRVSYKAYGHSMVVSPWGEVLAEAGEDETVLYADIDPDLLATVRKQLPLLQHRRSGLYTSINQGNVPDFQQSDRKRSRTMKKLYRIAEGKKAAGICSGIADMYNFDVTLVRLAFVFVTVLTQFVPGIITYLIGWYLIPEKEEVMKAEVKEE